jgi:DNA-binding response OmpR family regulator
MAKILIIDGDPDLLNSLVLVLRHHGHEAEGMLNASLLHEKIQSFAPDIVLMDVKLDEFNARELCHEIKANELSRGIHVILISASPKMLENYSECEASAVLEKPFNIQTLFEVIDQVLSENHCPVITNVSAG